MTHEELYERSGQQLVATTVGTDFFTGSPTHGGQFTENNPYYIQFARATNNEDRDALYAKAVEWQANYYNTLEERDYNSPTNRLARDRAAGINSDILAATSGGSSSSPAGSAIAAPQNDVQYSSVGSRTSRVLESINTACNLVSTVASFGTASIGAIRDIKMMPSEVSLAETQAYIAEQTKDSVVESSELSAIQSRLALVNQLSSYFTPESSTDDYSTVLSTLGIAPEMIPQYESAIRDYHKNPAYKASYEDNIARANDGAARNAIYTSDVLNELYDKTLSIEQADKGLTMLTQSLERTFNEYLVHNGYAEQTAENVMSNTIAQSDALELTRSRLSRDIKAFGENLNDVKDSVHGIDARIKAIVGNAKNERRMISPTEQFEIDTLNNLRNQLMTLGSSQLQSVYSIINNANAIMYQNAEMLNVDGNPIINAAVPRFLRTINTTFGHMVTNDTDIVNTLLQSLPYVGGLFTITSSDATNNSGTLSYTATY